MKYFRVIICIIVLSSCVTDPGQPAPAKHKPRHDRQSSTTGNTNTPASKKTTGQSDSAEKLGISLVVPDKETVLKKQIDEAILAKIIYGSPDSLYAAFMELGQNGTAGDKMRELYLEVISRIMHIVYPLDVRVPSYKAYFEEHPYLKGLHSITKQEYPYTMPTSDFLSAIIPTFVLIQENPTQLDLDDIEDRLNSAEKINESSVLLAYLKGILYEKKHKTNQSEAFYEHAWQSDSSCYPAGIAYAQNLSQNGAQKHALKIIEALMWRYANQTQIELVAAELYAKAHRWGKAEKMLATIRAKDTNNKKADLLHIYMMLEQQEFLKANALLDTFKEKNKTNKDYLLFRARLATEWSKDIQSTIQLLDSAYALYPNDLAVLLTCARILFKTKSTLDGKGAFDFIRAILVQNPENSEALELLVRYNLSEKQYPVALQNAQEYARLYPSDKATVLLTRAYVEVNQGFKALTLARKMYAKKQTETAISIYALSLYTIQDNSQLQTLINRHINTVSSPLKSELYYYSAALALTEEARVAGYRSSLLANPQNEKALFALYQHYYDKANYQKADYYLKQILAFKAHNKRYLQLEKDLQRLLAE